MAVLILAQAKHTRTLPQHITNHTSSLRVCLQLRHNMGHPHMLVATIPAVSPRHSLPDHTCSKAYHFLVRTDIAQNQDALD